MKKLKRKIKNKLGDKKVNTLKKIFNVVRIVKNIVCWTLIAVLAVAMIIFLITKVNGGTPSVFGYSIRRVLSGSMEPELAVGDVIINKEIGDPSEVHIGDIITFHGGDKFANQDVTHRVIVAPYTDDSGDTVIVTKGDANELDDGVISIGKVHSKFLTKIAFLKDVYNFFFSKWGLLVFIFLLLLIFFDEIMNIVKLIVNSSENELPESFHEIVQRIKNEEEQKEPVKGEPSLSQVRSAEDSVSGSSDQDDVSEKTPQNTKKVKSIKDKTAHQKKRALKDSVKSKKNKSGIKSKSKKKNTEKVGSVSPYKKKQKKKSAKKKKRGKR